MTTFENLDLDARILDALNKKGYTQPTPIQEQAIPHVLDGKDLLGIAQTGTGKTAAFSLPILNNLTKTNNRVKPNQIRSLILTPTRELASQIAENISGYGKDLQLRHGVIFGGVAIGPQIRMMSQGLDILIATPGRLLDLMSQGHIRYSNLEIFVLDEADRMLDMGFIHDVKKVIKKLPEKRQTLFFSATMPADIANLADSILTQPVKVEVTPQATTVDRIDQKICLVAKGNKNLLLKKILKKGDVETVLVFTKTKHGANRIVQFLEKENIKAAAIHGNKSQGARERALNGFRSGTIQVLIATDIAARGIDVPGISHVINFDIPIDPESYVHRIGRTARAGKEGVAISFCDPSERSLLRAVEKVIKFSIPVDETHPMHGVESSAPFSGKSDFGPRFTNADRSRAKSRGESSRAANQRNKEASGSRDSEEKPRSRNNEGTRSNFRKSDERSSRNRDERRPSSRSHEERTSRTKEEEMDLKFNQESSNVNRKAFAGYKSKTSSGKFGAARKRYSKDDSSFRDDSRGRSSGRRGENKDSRSDGDIYVSARDARDNERTSRAKPTSKGKNFSYAGARERKFGDKKKSSTFKKKY